MIVKYVREKEVGSGKCGSLVLGGVVMQMRKILARIIKGLTGVERMSFDVMMFGLYNTEKNEWRLLWTLVNRVEESRWDGRNLVVCRKKGSGSGGLCVHYLWKALCMCLH